MLASTAVRDRTIAQQVISNALAEYHDGEDTRVNGFVHDDAANVVLDALDDERSISSGHLLLFACSNDDEWNMIVAAGKERKRDMDARGVIFPPFLNWDWADDESYARLAIQHALTETYKGD